MRVDGTAEKPLFSRETMNRLVIRMRLVKTMVVESVHPIRQERPLQE